ncbi:MAG: A/G-specific adenine glycosylase [Saprospiraceae bacterium]
MAIFFARKLLKWHLENPRLLPWGDEERNPYHIWLSEIIMQQTRIEQGAKYYHGLINAFPTLEDLAAATSDEVMRQWQGLGYYTRARNLHKAAKHIVQNLNGLFPDSYSGLLDLPGIGPYSAAAIASFAFGHRHVVVDGNVKRVIARFAGIHTSIDDAWTHKTILELATTYMKDVSPAIFNQAIMNFGALVCKPKLALCSICPLSTRCYAFQNHMVYELPLRSKKKLNRVRHFHFILLCYRGKILLHRRDQKDIWQGLFVPPIIETASSKTPSVKGLHSFVLSLVGHNSFEERKSFLPVTQQLSHQTIIGRFVLLQLNSTPGKLSTDFVWANKKTLQDFAKPKMVADFVKLNGVL